MATSGPSETLSGAHGSYRRVKLLGEGGMGRTTLVRRESDGAELVLKELHLQQASDWKAVELFEREAAVLESLDHPGIPRFVDHINQTGAEEGGALGLVQTLAPGETLAQTMARGALSHASFEAALRSALEILAYLATRTPPIIHRDITPKNVMFDGTRAYLIDFGSVRWSLRESTQLTSVGTFGFMAPEQTLGQPTPASDMYALGLTFCALAARTDPSEFPVDPATGQVDVRRLLRGHPSRVVDVLEAMTRPGLAARLGDPREALRRLDARHAPVPATRPTPHKPPRAANLMLVAGVVVMLAAAGAVVFLNMSAGGDAAVSEATSVTAPPVTAQATPEPAPPPPEPAPPEPVVRTPPPAPEPVPLEAEGSAQITLESTPPGAEVYIGDTRVCVTPCAAKLTFGRYTLEFRGEGKTLRRQLMLVQDTTLAVKL